MLKVTLKFTFYILFVSFPGCSGNGGEAADPALQHYRDSVAEARIDSAYAAIKTNCDTLMVYQVPLMVDSLLKDSAWVPLFFDTGNRFSDADQKVEKVIRQLQADCNASLQKETYKRARLRQAAKKQQHKKAKA